MGATEARRKSPVQTAYDIVDEDDMYVAHGHSSARRYKQPVQRDTLEGSNMLQGAVIQPRRSSIAQPVARSTPPRAASTPLKREDAKRLPLLAVVLGMLVMALFVFGATSFSSWWQIHQDDMRYGRPRTFQLDALVGHEDGPGHPTHLIFLNLNRHVEIIELPGGDAAHAHIYQGPLLYGPGQDLTPVTGEVRDVNGDGRPDIIVHIQNQSLVLINDGTQFRPQQIGDRINM